MPIYEYECTSCGKKIERIQKLSDALLVECPECGKPSLHRLVSAPSFQLKGTGWYVTDFRDKKGEHKIDTPKTEHSAETASEKSNTSAETNKNNETKTTESKTPETKKTETKKADD